MLFHLFHLCYVQKMKAVVRVACYGRWLVEALALDTAPRILDRRKD